MKIKKSIAITIHAQPREPGPLSFGEHKDLIDFFSLLSEWDQQENLKGEQLYTKSNETLLKNLEQ